MMFDLLVTVCLAAEPETCVDRRVAFPEPVGQEECLEAGAVRAEQWLATHSGLRLQDWTCSNASDAPALDIVEVAPGLLVHAGRVATPDRRNAGDVANAVAVVGNEAVAVIDAGGSRAVGEAWLAAIRQATSKPIRYLILTHMHPDHTLGAEPFSEAGAEVIGHHKLAAALAARRDTYLQNFERLLGRDAVAGTEFPAIDRMLDAPTELDLGGRILLLEPHSTAHTDNDLTVVDRQTGTLIAGDLVFLDHAPALDGSITGWLDVLAPLTERQGIKRVVPGHGPAQASWPEGGVPTQSYLSVLAEESRAAIAAGEPMSQAIRHLGETQRGDWALFDEYNPRNATAAYKELEWE